MLSMQILRKLLYLVYTSVLVPYLLLVLVLGDGGGVCVTIESYTHIHVA